MLLIDAIIIIAAILIVSKSADILVDSAARIAVSLNVSVLIIGLTVVAFGTSAPEMAVSATAALKGHGNIAVANVVGSNIFNLCIILGLVALIRPLKTTESLVKRDSGILFAGTLVLFVFMYDFQISTIEGIIFFAILLSYLAYLGHKGKKPVVEEEISEEEATRHDPLQLALGLLGVVVGAHFLVESSVSIATILGVPEWAIGVTIVAFGTSVPELATAIAAARKEHYSMSAGNLIGSDIFNMFGVIGIAGILSKMTFSTSSLIDVGLLVGTVGIVALFLRTGYVVSRKEGLGLFIIGIARWIHVILTA